MSRPRLVLGLAGFIVAFVLVVALKANGYEHAPFAVFAAALVAGTAIAIVVAKGW